MKVINDLVVVEVPKGYEVCILYGYVQILDMYNTWNPIEELPFPCTIIGLASDIGLDEFVILQAANYDTEVSLWAAMNENNITIAETTDLLFLKRI